MEGSVQGWDGLGGFLALGGERAGRKREEGRGVCACTQSRAGARWARGRGRDTPSSSASRRIFLSASSSPVFLSCMVLLGFLRAGTGREHGMGGVARAARHVWGVTLALYTTPYVPSPTWLCVRVLIDRSLAAGGGGGGRRRDIAADMGGA